MSVDSYKLMHALHNFNLKIGTGHINRGNTRSLNQPPRLRSAAKRSLERAIASICSIKI